MRYLAAFGIWFLIIVVAALIAAYVELKHKD